MTPDALLSWIGSPFASLVLLVFAVVYFRGKLDACEKSHDSLQASMQGKLDTEEKKTAALGFAVSGLYYMMISRIDRRSYHVPTLKELLEGSASFGDVPLSDLLSKMTTDGGPVKT
jgi:hypothetical protein